MQPGRGPESSRIRHDIRLLASSILGGGRASVPAGTALIEPSYIINSVLIEPY